MSQNEVRWSVRKVKFHLTIVSCLQCRRFDPALLCYMVESITLPRMSAKNISIYAVNEFDDIVICHRRSLILSREEDQIISKATAVPLF